MPLLPNCCFFLDLKVGTLIIGILCLLSGIINTISWAITCIAIAFFHAATTTAEKIVKTQPLGGFNFPEDMDDDEYEDTLAIQKANQDAAGAIMEWFNLNIGIVKVICFFLLALSLLLIVVASMLIHGVKSNRRGLLFPWIIVESIKAALLLIGAITMFSIFGGNEYIVYTGLSFFGAVGLEIYFILIVVSQYQALGIIRMHDEHALDMK